MTRWTLQADANEETSGGGRFTPAPRGVYVIKVASYKDGTTKTGRPMVTLECEINDDGPEFGKKVWINITQIPKGEKGHGIMIHALHAFGLDHDGKLDFDTSDFQGQRARALLGVEERNSKKKKSDGTPYINEVNFVEALYTDTQSAPDELPPPPSPSRKDPGDPSLSYATGAKPSRGPARDVPF